MTLTGNSTRTLVIERRLAHPPEKVWRALTEGPLLEAWLAANSFTLENDFAAVVGHRFTFRAPPAPHWDGIVRGEVLEVERPERLAYSWNSAGVSTVVIWTLQPAGGGVHLRLEQSGLPDFEPAYQGANYAWSRFLDALEGGLAGLD